MSSAQTLIDKAKHGVLSERQLADKLGVRHSFINRIAKGAAPLPPGLAARLAAEAGEDPIRAALDAVIDHEDDENKRTLLRRILKAGASTKR